MRNLLPGRNLNATAHKRSRTSRRSRRVLVALVSVVAFTGSGVAVEAQGGSGAPAMSSTAGAKPPSHTPRVSELASFGSGLGSGSAIGPDNALYVTDGNAGSLLRIDPKTGHVSTFATGLPRQVLGVGGAIDVEFIGHTAYVLVTAVGGDLLTPTGPVHFGDATGGIYRLNKDRSFTVIADIGTWSADHPPTPAYFITTGLQYALQRFRGGFVVTDGHHNRVLRVTLDGDISTLVAFGNVAPTGIEVSGNTVYIGQAGPIPHNGQDAKVVAVTPRSNTATDVASGQASDEAGLTVDVESGRGSTLYALLQGDWNLPITPANAGLPASPNTGALVQIEKNGTYTTVVDRLDRPTSLEFIGNTAFVVTLTGKVIRIDDVSVAHHGTSH